MSADNWGICPNCKKIHQKKMESAKEKAAKAYGQVTEERYLELVALANEPEKEIESTLREDYYLGIDADGVFSVTYSSHCNQCGFDFKFKEEKQLKTPGKKIN